MGNQFFITLKRPLTPRDSLKLTLNKIPTLVTVSTETGESNILDTRAVSWMYDPFKRLSDEDWAKMREVINKYPKGTPISEILKKEREKSQSKLTLP